MSFDGITYDEKGEARSFTGPQAVDVFRIAMLRQALSLYAEHGTGMLVTRGLTGKRALAIATEYTGKAYKRGRYNEALADLTRVFNEKRDATPQRTELRDGLRALDNDGTTNRHL